MPHAETLSILFGESVTTLQSAGFCFPFVVNNKSQGANIWLAARGRADYRMAVALEWGRGMRGT